MASRWSHMLLAINKQNHLYPVKKWSASETQLSAKPGMLHVRGAVAPMLPAGLAPGVR